MYVYMYMPCMMRLGLLVLWAGGSFCSFPMFVLLLSCALFLFLFICHIKTHLNTFLCEDYTYLVIMKVRINNTRTHTHHSIHIWSIIQRTRCWPQLSYCPYVHTRTCPCCTSLACRLASCWKRDCSDRLRWISRLRTRLAFMWRFSCVSSCLLLGSSASMPCGDVTAVWLKCN